MTLHPRPDQEQTIQQAIQAGLIATAEEALDVGIPTLRERLERSRTGVAKALHEKKATSLADIFEPVRGLADDLDVRRNPSTGRPVER